MSMVLHHLQTAGMTPEEQELRQMMWCNLQHLPNWPVWDAAFDAQLDVHIAAGTFGNPVLCPDLVDGELPNILCIQWSNLVKPDGIQKARACMYASCVK